MVARASTGTARNPATSRGEIPLAVKDVPPLSRVKSSHWTRSVSTSSAIIAKSVSPESTMRAPSSRAIRAMRGSASYGAQRRSTPASRRARTTIDLCPVTPTGSIGLPRAVVMTGPPSIAALASKCCRACVAAAASATREENRLRNSSFLSLSAKPSTTYTARRRARSRCPTKSCSRAVRPSPWPPNNQSSGS